MIFAEADGIGIAAIIVAITGLVTAIGGIASMILKYRADTKRFQIEQRRRDDHTDHRVDLVWQATTNRGRVESDKKLKKPQPPEGPLTPMSRTAELVLKDHVKEAFSPIAATLMDLRRFNPGLTRGKFAEMLEDRLGEWILRHICQVLDVNNYECYDAAWAVSGGDLADRKMSEWPSPTSGGGI